MEQLKVIKTIAGISEVLMYLRNKEYVAFDCETTGVTKDSTIIGFSVSADVDIAYYIVLAYWDVESQELISLNLDKEVLKVIKVLKGKKLIAHNAVFDCFMFANNFGIELIDSIHTDTMILGHLLNENRSNGLKELSASIFGEESVQEQKEMRESVHKNGGFLTKDKYELYKADCDLLAKYGAKDTILTIKLFYHFLPELFDQKLDKFFYEEESMPLLKGTTYQLNTIGLKVDPDQLQHLKGILEAECMEAKAYIHSEIKKHVEDKYPGTKPSNTFNIGASKQLSWLLFIKLQNEFVALTDGGKELCKALSIKIPYTYKARREFIEIVTENKGRVYEGSKYNYKTKKMTRPKKVGDVWNYIACGKGSLSKLSTKYKWVEKLLEYSKNLKLLNTYVTGIQSRMQYNVIRPSFFQHGTTSGRYSSRNPNFQNLPRDDKRIKSCIVSRPGKTFVGADYAQLEPRIFASVSKDEMLCNCFDIGHDFYSVVGAPIFDKNECSLTKSEADSFAVKYPELRDKAKVVALATPYGRTAAFQASAMSISIDESRELIEKYFVAWPKVELMMLESHEEVKQNGVVYNLFGRPRRIPEALKIRKIYGNSSHSELPYEIRTLLNLAMNHKVQSTGASIVNRASIAFLDKIKVLGIKDCQIVLQIHDELVVECLDKDAESVAKILKDCMERTVELPGVSLIAEPKIAKNLADIK